MFERAQYLSLSRKAIILIFLAIALSTVAALFFRNSDYIVLDDAYITYRYARNLAQGHGFVYNQGEKVLSTTAPLYAFLLAGAAKAGADIPEASYAIGLIALVICGLVLFFWLYPHSVLLAIVAPFLLIGNRLVLGTLGMESTFYMTTILTTLWLFSRGSEGWAFVGAGVAAMIRPDGILVIIVLALAQVFNIRKRPVPWRLWLLGGGLIGIFYGGLWAYFGWPIPITLSAKASQGNMVYYKTFLPSLVGWLQKYLGSWYSVFTLSAVTGLTTSLRKYRTYTLLGWWLLLYTVAFSMLQVASYPWYYIPVIPVIILLSAFGILTFRKRATDGIKIVGQSIHVPLLILLLAWGPPLLQTKQNVQQTVAKNSVSFRMQDRRREVIYPDVSQWVDASYPPSISVGTLEIGMIGYYVNRSIVDFAGLLQPDLAALPSRTYPQKAKEALHRYQPDVILWPSSMIPFAYVSSDPWFDQHYRFRQQFEWHSFSVEVFEKTNKAGEFVYTSPDNSDFPSQIVLRDRRAKWTKELYKDLHAEGGYLRLRLRVPSGENAPATLRIRYTNFGKVKASVEIAGRTLPAIQFDPKSPQGWRTYQAEAPWVHSKTAEVLITNRSKEAPIGIQSVTLER